jgi:hypothetical protein
MEYPGRLVPLPPYSAVSLRISERVSSRRRALAIGRAVPQHDRDAVSAEPVAVFQAIGERIPVVAEVLGQLEALAQRFQQRGLVVDAVQVKRAELELRCGGGGLQRFGRPGPVMHACVRCCGKVGNLHCRIL